MKNFKLFLSLLMLICFSVGTMWAEDIEYYSYTFTSKQFADDATAKTLGTITWTPTTTWGTGTGYWGYDASRGQQWASSSSAILESVTLTAGTSINNVSKIIVNAAIAKSGACKLSVKVGETAIGETEDLSQTATNYTFTAETPVSGVVSITLTNGSVMKAQYIKSITIYTACTTPVTITKGTEENGTYTLSATGICGDGDGGEVFISNITPAEGYEFDEITTSESGDVDNENKKVTGIKANTTITVLFKAKPKYTVSFETGEGNGSVDSETEMIADGGITLPVGPTSICADGWAFVGWAETAVSEETTEKPTLLLAGDNYKPSGNTTLYAVYARNEGGSGVAGNTTINATILGLGSYGDGTNKGDYKWSYTQLRKGDNTTIQGNSSKSSILWNTVAFPAAISKVELEVGYASGPDATAALCFADSEKPTESSVSLGKGTDYSLTTTGTLTITEGIPANSTYMSLNWTYYASYYSSVTVYWGTEGTIYYLSEPLCCTGYTITVDDAIEHGTVKAPSKACADKSVTLTATPDAHCQFVSWDVKGVDGEEITVSENKFTMPAKAVTVSAKFEEIKNAVSFTAPTGGMLVIRNEAGAEIESGDEIKGGASLTITAAPDVAKHYIGGELKVIKTGVTPEVDVTGEVLSSNVLTMPDYAISISASFIATYAINIVADGGQVSLNYELDGAEDGYAKAGTRVIASAVPDAAHQFKSLAVSYNAIEPDVTGERAEFTMPAEAVTITAEFTELTNPTISVDEEIIDFGEVDYKGVVRPQTFNVSGVALAAGKLTISCDNAAFEVSPASIDVDGTLKATPVTVTPTTNACGTFDGTITIKGGNAEDKELLVSLKVNKLLPGLEWSASEYTATIGGDNTFPTLRNPRNLPVTYSSLYENVAEIDADGVITLKKAGQTIIYINFAGNDTVEALAKDAIMYDLTVQKKSTAIWYVNATEVNSQTAMSGTALEEFPSDFSTFTDCSELRFVGWTTTAIVGKQAEAPATLITETTGLTMPEDDINYYAVFADQKMGIIEGAVISYDGTGGKAALTSIEGVTGRGLGTDYAASNSPYLIKLDGDNDYIQFALEYAPTSISVGYKKFSAGTSKIIVQECATANGTFDDVEELTISGDANSTGTLNTTKSFSQNYVRLLFNKGSNGSNVGVGPITVVGKKKGLVPYNFVTTCPKCDKVVTFAKAGEESGCTFELQIEGVTKESVKACEKVELDVVATLADGYELSNVALSGIEGASYAEGKITIPADVEGTLTVTATFSAINYTVTLAQTGDAEADLVGAKNNAHYDEKIEISASEVEGYGFINWTAEPKVTFADASARETSFTMPSSNVTVTANYAKILTIAEAIAKLDADKSATYTNTFVSGIISKVDGFDGGAITYWISVDGLTQAFEIFKGKGLNGAVFESVNDLQVGDKVIVLGTLKYYATDQVYELATGSKLYKHESGDPGLGIDNTEVEMNASKILLNGVIYIQRGDKLFNVQGQVIR